MSVSLSSLPPELLREILLYLPIANILSFASTSKENFTTATLALHTLHLAVLPRRIFGVLTFLNSYRLDENDYHDGYEDTPTLHQVIIPSELPSHLLEGCRKPASQRPRKPTLTAAQYRGKLLALQNKIASSVLSTSALSKIQTLSLHLYEIISPELTAILATSFDSLRNLHLNFSHPYLHDTCLPAHYWKSPVFLTRSPIWNALSGLGDLNAAPLKLRTLESLTIERAGITSVQLRKCVEHNPRLNQLILRNVIGVDQEFVQWLGDHYRAINQAHYDAGGRTNSNGDTEPQAKLEKLALEHCSALVLRSKTDFGWLDSLFNLEPSSSTGTGTRSAHENATSNNESYYTPKPNHLRTLSLLGSNPNAVSTNNLLSYLEEGKPPIKQVTLPDGRILVAKSGKEQQRIVPRKGPHIRSGTASRNASTRSLNDVEVDDGAATDNDDDSDLDTSTGSSLSSGPKPGTVSFLSEKKSLARWTGHWNAKTSANTNGVRAGDGLAPLMLENAAIEVDERHAAAAQHSAADTSRTSRPVVTRMRS